MGELMALLVAVLLGLKHATDPDHLTAVSSLLLGEQRSGVRRAASLGLAWGLGHATTLFAFGLPVVLFTRFLPDAVERSAEGLIGLVIMVLAVRLLWRWRQGHFHVHPHSHGAVRHAHPHVHPHLHAPSDESVVHTHPHAERLGRSPLAAFGIGLLHGVGGSAGAGVLLVGSMTGRLHGSVALLLFAGATALSMALVSAGFGYALARGAVRNRLADLVPLLAASSLLFGVWYSVGALLVT
jgi:ABC-type nickel/cobalt efflux system permease component RcnA